MKRKFLFIWLFFIAMVASIAPKVELGKAADTATTKITVHYKRTDKNYSGWDFYTWNYEPGGGEARAFEFTGSDNYGKIATVPLDEHFVGMKQMGFIVRKGGQAWLDKDIGSDRFLTIPETAPNGNYEIWLYQGLKNVFYSLEEAEDDKIVSSIFVNILAITKIRSLYGKFIYCEGVQPIFSTQYMQILASPPSFISFLLLHEGRSRRR